MLDPVQVPALVDTIWTADTWKVVGAAALFGAIGGFTQAITSTDPAIVKVDAQGKTTRVTAEIVYRALVGMIAAVAILYIAKPGDGIALIASSVVAGYAGHALMDALAARAKLAVTQETLKDTKTEATAAKLAAATAQLEATTARAESDRTRGDLDTALGALTSAVVAPTAPADAPEHVSRRQADARAVLNQLWPRYHAGPPPV
ncbi:MAG TPA: hypothetical protein VHE35_00245 [Kofleriaceae bacterium]|nr:hypothetical protein [Kofleriaceae bacterium]